MLLLDTHIWIYWQNQQKLPQNIINEIQNADGLAISIISCWEVAQLIRKGKVGLPIKLEHWIELATANVKILPINKEIALLSERLDFHHKDPADRFIIATSIVYQIPVVSLDAVFPKYREIEQLLIN